MMRLPDFAAAIGVVATFTACATSIGTLESSGGGGEGAGGEGEGGAGGAGGGTTSTTGTSSTSTSTGPCIYKQDCAALDDACNEGNCINGTCTKLPANDGSTCDDGVFCTDVDTCQAGACVSGAAKQCPAPDTCHLGVCDEATKSCGGVPGNDGAACDDGDPCTLSGTCLGGTCSKGPPIDCSGWNGQCTKGACDPVVGCVGEPVPDGTACDDALFCTEDDACEAGKCTGAPKACAPPGDTCSVGKCDELGKTCIVVAGNDGDPCDDGNACTGSGACSGGKCTGGKPANDGKACDDGDACTAGTKCSAGECGAPASTIVDCKNGDGCCPPGCGLGADDDCGPLVFDFTGAMQELKVPANVTKIKIEVWGAEGGTPQSSLDSCGGNPDKGGLGGYASGELAVVPGEVLEIRVGGAGGQGNAPGYNGGGGSCTETSTCSGGGGASDVRAGGSTLDDRAIVAGGGGGGEYSCGGLGGGAGGGLSGGNGAGGDSAPADGKGGTQASGGAGGMFGGSPNENGSPGTKGQGGSGALTLHAGGGGGGYYGGGGGGQDGHAGGGSSYIGGVKNGTTQAGVRTGHGQIKITW